jgi:hypothetical protein
MVKKNELGGEAIANSTSAVFVLWGFRSLSSWQATGECGNILVQGDTIAGLEMVRPNQHGLTVLPREFLGREATVLFP